MKSNKYWIWAACLAACCCYQCEGEIELDYSDFSPKLVVHGQLSPDKSFEIAVGASTTPVSHDIGTIPADVDIVLTDLTEGAPIDVYREDDTFVAPQKHPVAGHTYRIQVHAPQFESVAAQSEVPDNIVPDKMEVTNFSMVESKETEGRNNISYDLNIDFGDTGTPYLHLLFEQESKIGPTGQPEVRILYSVEPEYPEEQGLTRHHERGVLVHLDKLETPGSIILNFRQYTIDELEEIGDMILEVRTVSPDYYRYFDSVSRQLRSREDPFAEPIHAFNNIQGGLGNFSAYNVRKYELRIRK